MRRSLSSCTWNERLAGRMPKFLPDVPEVREDVADYLGECQAFDASLLPCADKLGQLR